MMMEKTTLFDDAKLKNAEALMLTFKSVTGDTFAAAIHGAADLSSAFGMDLNSATVMLGKALEDPIAGLTALHLVGVSFSDQEKTLIKDMYDAGDAAGAQAKILEILNGQVGGVADAMATSASGSFQQMTKSVDQLRESFGGLITMSFQPLFDSMKGLSDNLRSMLDGAKAELLNASVTPEQNKLTGSLLARDNSLQNVKTSAQYDALIAAAKPEMDALKKSGYDIDQQLWAAEKKLEESQKYRADNGFDFGQEAHDQAVVDRLKLVLDLRNRIQSPGQYQTAGLAPKPTGGSKDDQAELKKLGSEWNTYSEGVQADSDKLSLGLETVSQSWEKNATLATAWMDALLAAKARGVDVDAFLKGHGTTLDETAQATKNLVGAVEELNKTPAKDPFAGAHVADGKPLDLFNPGSFKLGPQTTIWGTLPANDAPKSGPSTFTDGVRDQLQSLNGIAHNMGLPDIFNDTDAAAKRLSATLENIGSAMEQIGAQGLASGFEEVGKAWATGANAGDAFNESMANMVLKMMDALPLLLLEAGLKELINGDPMGWVLLALGGGIGIADGYVHGKIGHASGDVVSSPTTFMANGGQHQAGEAGAEGILPLARMSNGDLGVQSAGGGSGQSVVVNIINQAGANVQASESTGPDSSRQIQVLILSTVAEGVATGKLDKTFNSRYGLRFVGRQTT